MALDLKDWLTEPEAARRLGVSTRTLRTWASQGKRPERKYRKREGNRDEPVYNPGDVEELEASKPVVLAKEVAPVLPPIAAPPVPSYGFSVAPLVPFFERLTMALERRLAPPEPVKPWVTMKEASGICGLSEHLLRSLVRTGKLGCLRDKQGWKVKRTDLEGLEASKLRNITAELRQNLANRRATA